MTEAIRVYSTAKGYVQSVYLIITNPGRYLLPDDTTIMLSYHMLLGFAVELYLKSYLMHKGYVERELRGRGVGHNLHKLLEMAEAEVLSVPEANKLVGYLGDQHDSFEYRYMRPDSSYFIRYQAEVFAEMSKLDHYVDTAIGASASHGRKPSVDGWTIDPAINGWRIPTSGLV